MRRRLRRADAVRRPGRNAAMRRGLSDLFTSMQGLAWSVGLLVIVLAVSVWVILRVRAQIRDNADRAGADHGMLSQLGELHRQGHLSEEEYRSIKSRLVQRLDGSVRAQSSTE